MWTTWRHQGTLGGNPGRVCECSREDPMGLGRLTLVPGAKSPTALERDLGNGVVLKLLRRRHARGLYVLTDRNRERLRPWLPWVDRVHGIAGTLNFIEQGLGQANNSAGFQSGIWVDGDLSGVVGTHRIDWENRSTGLGYWIDGAQEGRGIVTRSVAAVLDYLFISLNLHRVEIRAATDNQRSRAVPERLGFRLEGVLRQDHRVGDVWQDLAVYGLLRSEWSGVPAALGFGGPAGPTDQRPAR
jgi:ribosomal-protein-serine acetyltransferase